MAASRRPQVSTAVAERSAGAADRLAASFAGALARAGTTTVFGVPGGGNNLELVEACEDAGLRFVLTHGETAAAIMASVDGELRRVPGACLATRGPGAASIVNGVAHAMLDRTPLAVITDAVSFRDRPRIPHQRLDQTSMFSPIVKWSGAVGVDGADETLVAALGLTTAPPPGPVHLDFVPDAPSAAPPVFGRRVPPTSEPRQALQLLAAARRPVVALGVGARSAVAAVRELLEGKPWPVLTTYKAKGVVPETWPNAAGLLTGAAAERPVLEAADLVLAVGLDPVELIPAPWPYDAPVVSIAAWPTTDGYFTPRAELVGPLDELLATISASLPPGFDGRLFGRQTRIAAEEELLAAPATGIGPQHIVVAAREAARAGTIATVDSGAHMLVAMPLWEVEAPDEVMISSGLATMGFALPAAVAASLARPDEHVICFTGDGGLSMALGELETVARLQRPIVIVVFNDSALSLIEAKQRSSGHGGKNAVRYVRTDFAKVAASVGMESLRLDERDHLAPAFARALSERRPFLLDISTDPSGYPHVLSAIRGGARG
jgi:acetolactate synthase I/II/III large subunit